MSTLQELLNYGLVDIGSDDSRFEKMQAAASVLATKFEEEPSLLIPATLISLDETVDENDPMFSLVEKLVISEWKTLRNTHVNRPRELLRSIMIDALAASINKNAEVAGTVWNTAVSLLRHRQARLGKASPVVEKFLQRAAQISETEAVKRAGLVALTSKKSDKKRAPIESIPLRIGGTINDEDILKDIAGAAGPNFPNQDLENPNPHWPQQGPNWSHNFTPRMAGALAKAVNLGNDRLAKSLTKNLASYLNAFEKQLSNQFREFKKLEDERSQIHESSRMRLEVLWWSESLYSPSFQTGYRDLPLPVAAVAAAVDLATIVPALAPASVCYVLGEAVFRIALILDVNGDQPIISYLKDLTSAKPNFENSFPSVPTSDARLPLIDLVGEASAGSEISSEIILSRAGVDSELKLSSFEFAMWVFRDLQARRLVEELR